MEKKAILHTIHPSIKELKKTVIEDQLTDTINSAYAIRKIGTISGKELDEFALALTQDVQDHFKGFRLQEIVQAIQDGAKGLYEHEGDMNTVSLELVLKWIRRYAEKVRKEALHKQKVHEEKQAEKDKDAEREKGYAELKKEINRVYAEYLTKKPLNECANVEYPVSALANQFVYLEKLELIKLSDSIYLSCGERAKKEIEGKKPQRDDKREFDLFHRTKENQMLNLARYYALENQFELWEMEGKQTIF